MERERFRRLYHLLRTLAPAARPKGCVYSDVIILMVYAWAVLHERPVSWATDPRHWPPALLDFDLPSQSTLSRRLRRSSLQQVLVRLHQHLAEDANDTLVKRIDSKPLPVGLYSNARDARWGHTGRTRARGYKLHAVYGRGGYPIAWEVVPMNASEQRVAKRLVRHLRGGGYLLGDSVYDVNALYTQAAEQNHQLLAPRKRPDAGLGHRPHTPQRLRSIHLLGTAFGRTLYAQRTRIERDFSRLTCTAGGLAGLPAWVRTLRRVHQWVAIKLAVTNLRRSKQRLAA